MWYVQLSLTLWLYHLTISLLVVGYFDSLTTIVDDEIPWNHRIIRSSVDLLISHGFAYLTSMVSHWLTITTLVQKIVSTYSLILISGLTLWFVAKQTAYIQTYLDQWWTTHQSKRKK